MVTRIGIPVVIANGEKERVLERVIAGEEVGTLFLPEKERK
jgi:glutamate 5-kinase